MNFVTRENYKKGMKVSINPVSCYAHQAKGAVYGIAGELINDVWCRVDWVDKDRKVIRTMGYRVSGSELDLIVFSSKPKQYVFNF